MSKLTGIVTLIIILIASPVLAQTATPSASYVATAQAQLDDLQSQLQDNPLDTATLDDLQAKQNNAIDFDSIASAISIVKYVTQPDAGEGLFGPFWTIIAVLASSLVLDIVWSGFYPGFRLFFFLFRGVVWIILFVERIIGEWGKAILAIVAIVGVFVGMIFLWGDVFLDALQVLAGYIIDAIRPILLFLQPAINAIVYLMQLTIQLIGQVGRWIVDTVRLLADMIWNLWLFLNPFN